MLEQGTKTLHYIGAGGQILAFGDMCVERMWGGAVCTLYVRLCDTVLHVGVTGLESTLGM
jgi:hypothetical protein